MNNEILIYDIETKTYGKPDSTKDELKFFGCYSYITNKTYILTNKEKIQLIINKHKFLVGFNTKEYDNLILKRFGINLEYKFLIDLREIFLRRAGEMKVGEDMLKDIIMHYSLDEITKIVGVVNKDTGKIDFDYTLLNKSSWTKEELKLIYDYTERDLEITKKLYDWCEDYFSGFKDYMTDDDVKAKRYITSKGADFSYRAICKSIGWEPTMSDKKEDITLKGGYVAYPAGEQFDGDIYCLDFRSLYPHITIQCNLYGRKKESVLTDNRPVWFGENKWKVDGTYYADDLSPICKLFQKLYKDRLLFKKNKDKREYSIKILLNTGSYGILNTPYYEKVFDPVAGRDCPAIGKQWILFARKLFREAGYLIIYTDTDSIYLLDIYKNKEQMIKVKDKIISEIKKTVPFPQDTFDMGIDEIKYIFFFKGGNKDKDDETMDSDDVINKPKGLMKKNYIYVSKDDKVIVKNLGIRKKSNSLLSKKIFEEYLVPQIKKGTIKFNKTYINNLITKLLEEDFKLIALRKDVGEFKQYEKSPTSLPAQISKKYGAGIHYLIPNIKGIGIGKGKSYCTIEEYKQHNLKRSDIDLSNVWSELEYFIKPQKIVSIFDFEKK